MQIRATTLILTFSVSFVSSCRDKAGDGGQSPLPPSTSPEHLHLNLPTDLPEGWELESGAQSPRVATYRISSPGTKQAPPVMAITRFPGAVGGLLANVNRWREEAGLQPIGSEDLETAVETNPLDENQLHLVIALGEEQSILGAILPLPHRTWFLKLSGATELVTGQQEAFRAFVSKLSLGPAPPSLPPPHSRPALSFIKPANWREGKPSVARIASFRMGEPGGLEAQLAIIPLRGSGGPELSVVNQWRTLVGLTLSHRTPCLNCSRSTSAEPQPTDLLTSPKTCSRRRNSHAHRGRLHTRRGLHVVLQNDWPCARHRGGKACSPRFPPAAAILRPSWRSRNLRASPVISPHGIWEHGPVSPQPGIPACLPQDRWGHIAPRRAQGLSCCPVLKT